MKIVDSDAFLEMPLSTQCLYFHLNMRADDDGFVGNSKKIMRMIGANEDDLKILLAKRFLIYFEDSVVVIKHWWIHNTLSKDRYSETTYIDDKAQLYVKENKAYTLNPSPTDKPAIEERKKEKREYSDARVKRLNALKESDLPTHFNRSICNAFNRERCPVCGCTMDVNDTTLRPSVQHNVPISKGGKHELSNISVICQSCNCSLNNQVTPPYNTEEVIEKWNQIIAPKEESESVIPAYIQEPFKSNKSETQSFLQDCFNLITEHNKTAVHKIPVSRDFFTFIQSYKEGRELLELTKKADISDLRIALGNYLKVAKSKTWMNTFSISVFCKNYNEYTKEFFEMTKYINVPRDKVKLINEQLDKALREHLIFRQDAFIYHRKDWIAIGMPEGEELLAIVKQWEKEDEQNGVNYAYALIDWEKDTE